MKLKYACLDSALDLWPPGHFALGFFASRIGLLEMECSALGFSYCDDRFSSKLGNWRTDSSRTAQ